MLKEGSEGYLFVPAGPEVLSRDGRLKHMDDTGIEASILYPGEVISMWVYFEDIADRNTLFHSFNQYLHEDWGFNHLDRLYGAPLIGLDDLDAAVREAEWLIERGACASSCSPLSPPPVARRRILTSIPSSGPASTRRTSSSPFTSVSQ